MLPPHVEPYRSAVEKELPRLTLPDQKLAALVSTPSPASLAAVLAPPQVTSGYQSGYKILQEKPKSFIPSSLGLRRISCWLNLFRRISKRTRIAELRF